MASKSEMFLNKHITKKRLGQKTILANIPVKLKKKKPKRFSELL